MKLSWVFAFFKNAKKKKLLVKSCPHNLSPSSSNLNVSNNKPLHAYPSSKQGTGFRNTSERETRDATLIQKTYLGSFKPSQLLSESD